MSDLIDKLALLAITPPGWGGRLARWGAGDPLPFRGGAYAVGLVIGLAGALGKLSGTSDRWLRG